MLVVHGVQYAAPYEQHCVTHIKNKHQGRPIDELLAETRRLQRGHQVKTRSPLQWWLAQVLSYETFFAGFSLKTL